MDVFNEQPAQPEYDPQGVDVFSADLSGLPVTRAKSRTDFWENLRSGFVLGVKEGPLEVPIVREGFTRKILDQHRKIEELTGRRLESSDLNLSDPALQEAGGLNTTVELARRARERKIAELSAQHPGIKTDDELWAEALTEHREGKAREVETISEAGTMGTVGAFVGGVGAIFTNPIYLATLPFGASLSTGILRAALVNAGVAAGTEVVNQPFVLLGRKDLGEPYSVGEAAEAVGQAALGGAALTAGVKAIQTGVQAAARRLGRRLPADDLIEAFDRHVTEPSRLEQDARYIVEDHAAIVRENPFTLGEPSHDAAHFQATAKALQDLGEGRPVDVQEFVLGLEPRREMAGKEADLRQLVLGERELAPGARADVELSAAKRAIAEGAEANREAHLAAVEAQAKEVLAVADLEISTASGLRSARELIQEAGEEMKLGSVLRDCLIGG